MADNAGKAKLKVLIVDDLPVNRLVPQLMLEEMGWQVKTASSGYEAVELVGKDSYDLMLLDISMPGMSGMEVCNVVRSNTALASLPIIAYTAYARPADRDKFIAAGFDEVLIKPITRDSLSGAITKVLLIGE